MVTSRTGWFNEASEILFGENVQAAVEGIARRKYKMRQLMMTGSSDAEVYAYYQATNRNMGQDSAGTDKLLLKNSTVRGIPKGSQFPHDTRELQRLNAYMEKHGLEQTILWEDIISNNVNPIKEGLLDLTSAVARSIDFLIYNAIDDATGINSIAAQATWDNATVANRRPAEDLLRAAAQISTGENTAFEADAACLSPGDAAYVFSNDYVLDAFSATSSDLIANGVVGKLAGLGKIIVSSVVEADEAVVLQSGRIGGFMNSIPLTTKTIENWGIDVTIRALERGTAFITNPGAGCLITNTRS